MRRLQRRSSGRRGERGQIIIVFALVLVTMVAMSGLLLDGGLADVTRRQAQSAADTAALAAAKAVVAGATDGGLSAAQGMASSNGFATGQVSCPGGTATNGLTVNRPPASGLHTGDSNYVEVLVTKPMGTTFSRVVGQSCWLVSARAVAAIASSQASGCSFCALNNTKTNHTLLLQNGAELRVDGDIFTNSTSGCATIVVQNGMNSCNDGSTCTTSGFKVCGDGFDIFGTPANPPAYISARSISVVGGWETHDQNVVYADTALPPPTYATTCANKPDPPSQPSQYDPSNVCIHMPPMQDPFAGLATPTSAGLSIPTASSCSALNGAAVLGAAGTASKQAVTSVTSARTLCPGIYDGGIAISGANAVAYLQPGIYYIADSANATGFSVTNGASVDGSAGVMIFLAAKGPDNKAATGLFTINQIADGVDTPADPDLAVNTSYPYSLTPSQFQLTANANSKAAPVNITYQVKVTQPAGAPKFNGTITFYDGSTPINSYCSAPSNLTVTNLGGFTAKCTISYVSSLADPVTAYGTHGISVLYQSVSGHLDYDDTEAILSPREVVNTTGVTGGSTLLSGLNYGPYKGFVVYQDAASALDLLLSPAQASSVPDCSGSWMTAGIPTTAPAPCGSLGGVSGTIYAGNATAVTQITAGGVADVQVVSGMILVTNGANARFAYTPSKFAYGGIRLVE